ncbi:MAG: hypothetical protein K6T65_11360 [Peptococcaceae bacterium]|nr:hypothetical protein [Peptococcaceae bacterium]
MYAGEPPAAERYDSVIANGVKVFIPKDAITAPEGISISMAGEGAWRGLSIQGLLH